MSVDSSIISNRPSREPGSRRARLVIWLPIIAGLFVLYLPSLVDLFRGIWSTDQQAHGPIVLALACWLAYRKWPEMLRLSDRGAGTITGWSIFVCGLLFYIVGRSQDILIFEIGSVIWLLSG